MYPAAFPEVIAVAATDQSDRLALFLPDGFPPVLSNFGATVDVTAPGIDLVTTTLASGFTTSPRVQGTSFAAPHVSGLAALIWSVNPALTNAQVRAVIEGTCENIDALNPNHAGQLGKGRINAFRALASLSVFQLHLPDVVEAFPGGSGTVGAAITRVSGFTGDVAFSVASPLPSGISATFAPAATTGNLSQMTVNVANSVAQGQVHITVRATGGNLVREAVTRLVIKGFTLSLSVPSVILKGDEPALKSADVIVTVNRAPGFTGPVNLSLEGLPAGADVTAVLDPTNVTGSTSVLRVSAGRFAAETTFALTIRGTSGTLSDTAQLVIDVVGSGVVAP